MASAGASRNSASFRKVSKRFLILICVSIVFFFFSHSFLISMTRVDSTMFCDVQPFELFSNAHLDPTRAPGFARMTLQFNTIGTWVAHCLLVPDSKSSDRATMISVFVALAKVF